MPITSFVQLYVFVLAGFVGYQVITRVPPLLPTPLMSATNAISGISLVGSLVAAGANRGLLSSVLGFIAVASATTNIVGGFLITDRMLKMFRRDARPALPDVAGDGAAGDGPATAAAPTRANGAGAPARDATVR